MHSKTSHYIFIHSDNMHLYYSINSTRPNHCRQMGKLPQEWEQSMHSSEMSRAVWRHNRMHCYNETTLNLHNQLG